jgi:hypothetical protein
VAGSHLWQSSQSTCTPGNLGHFFYNWICSAEVNLYAANSTLRTQADLAAGDWRTKIYQAGASGLPAIFVTNESSQPNGTVTGTATGSAFCGNWHPDNHVLTVDAVGSGCSSGNSGSLLDMFRHELGHAFGWEGSGVDKGGFAGASDHCVMHLPSTGFNTSICAHEIEGALAAYNLRTLPSDFWEKQFVVGSASSLSPATVAVGSTVQMASPGNWVLDRGGQVTGSYTWTSSNTAAATVNASTGVVTGVGAGTTTIRARPTNPGSYLFTTAFEVNGVSATVTVTQGLAPLVVSDILIWPRDTVPTPIYATGTYQFTAVIGAGDTTGLFFRWIFKDSRSPNDSTVIGDVDTVYTYGARTVSYNIGSLTPTWTLWVKAIPMRDTMLGSYAIREWPVCVEPVEEMLRAKPDEENDAVGGC